MKDIEFSLAEASEYMHVTKQAIYNAITLKKLKATKVERRWRILKSDIDEYRMNKFNRDNRKYNGEYVFDMHKGEYSVQQVCRVFSDALNKPYSCQHIYYLMRTGQLKAFRKGSAWVIRVEDAQALLNKEFNCGGQYVRQMRFA